MSTGLQLSRTGRDTARSPRRLPLGLLLIPAVLVIVIFFVLPLARLIGESFLEGGTVSFQNYVDLFSSEETFFVVLFRTAWIALLVTLVTLGLGYPLAYAATRLKGAWGAILLVLVLFPFFTSALVRTYAWRAILADNGPINEVLLWLGIIDSPVRLVYNDIGVVIGMAQVLLPMMVLPIYARMMSINRSLLLASRTMGASPLTAWRSVFLPQTVSGVAAGSTIVFVSALGYYVTPLLLQGASTPLFAQRIDTLIAIPGRTGEVAAQSAVVLLIALLLMYLLRDGLGISTKKRRPRRSRPPASDVDEMSTAELHESEGDFADASERNSRNWLWRIEEAVSRARFVVLGLFVMVALTLSVLPMIAIVMLGFSNDSFLRFPPSGYSTRWFEAYFANEAWLSSTWLSVWVSCIAALIVAALAAVAAFAISRSRKAGVSVASYLAMVAPMVVPQVVVAVALLYFLIPLGLAGRPIALIISYVVIGLPLAVILLTTAFRNLDSSYEKASATLGATPAMTMRRIVIPMVLPSIGAALIFVFATAFGDLVFAQFVGGIGTPTLERQMYRSIREEVSPEVAAVGTLMIGVILVLFVLMTMSSRSMRAQVRGLIGRGRKTRG